MSSDQNQHYLPQSYQRGWAGGDGQVHVYRWAHRRLICELRSTRSTGGRAGLYYVPMAPPDLRNDFEDRFWKRIDQWGADGLKILRDRAKGEPTLVQLERLAVWLLSLELRNPRKLLEIDDQAKIHVFEMIGKLGYSVYRRPHHPDTFEEFQAALAQPGLSEFGAQALRELVVQREIRKKLLTMDWQVVTVSNSEPILTSDVPLIKYRGLADHDGLWLLPLSTTEFLAIFNRGGPYDMKAEISINIRDRVFIEAMNKFVVRQKIDWVYAADDSLMPFVSCHWAESEGSKMSPPASTG